MNYFKRIGFALAFSPTAEAMLAETARITSLFHAELILIHVGEKGQNEENLINSLLEKAGLSGQAVKIVWEQGEPADRILKACQRERVDLLVAGALNRENLVKYYVGTIARKIMRKADCSIMMIVHPSTESQPVKNVVVNAEDSAFVLEALRAGCLLSESGDQAWLHIVREIKLYSLAMSHTGQHSEEEYNDIKQRLLQDEMDHVEKMLSSIPHSNVKINVKMLSGKSGFELCRFAERKQADWLVVGAPSRRFGLFDRVFPHDLEYVFADLPCNLLLVNPRKEERRG